MSTGLPSPKCFDAAANNGGDREVVITPPDGYHVVVFGVRLGVDLLGATTLFQLRSGSVVVAEEAAPAPGTPAVLTSVLQPTAFPKGTAVTARVTACTAGTIQITAALVY